MDETDQDFIPGEPKKRKVRDETPPRYRLTTPQYINDRYYDEGIEIVYKGTPNEGMEPVNASAERRVEEWLDSLPSRPQRHEDFIMQAMMNRPRHEVTAPTATKRKASRIIGKETPEEDNEVEVIPPDLTRVKGPKKQMGTIVHEVPSPGSI
jgi:hypothetical protein